MEGSTNTRQDAPEQRIDLRSPEQRAEQPKDIHPIDKAASGKTLTQEEHNDALAWLLADDDDDESLLTKSVDINVGTSDMEQWVTWVIRPVDNDLLRELQQASNRAQRRAGVSAPVDGLEYELRVVAYGTVSPDLQKAAKAKNLAAPDPMYGPMQIIKHRFRNKPGLITQLSIEIMNLSGFDDADLRDSKLVKAAGNS